MSRSCIVALGALAALFAAPGCGASGGAAPAVALEITSPQDRATVAGPFRVAGRAQGGAAEVAIDAGPFVPAEGESEWSFQVDTAGWEAGWHLVRVRVRNGGAEIVRTLNVMIPVRAVPAPTQPPPPIPPAVPPPAPPPPSEIDGLVARWTFSDGDGSDTSGNGFDATLRGATAAEGSLDGAVAFDGIDDVVTVEDSAGKPPSAFASLDYGTIAIRFRYDSIYNNGTTAELVPLFHYGSPRTMGPGQGFDSVAIYVAHGSLSDPAQRQIYFTILENDRVKLCFDSNSVVLEEGRWYHYVVTIGPSGHRAYLDGQQLTLRYNAGTTPTTHAFFTTVASPELLAFGTTIFGATRNWWNLDGRIDEVAVYDRDLSADEVTTLFEQGP